MAKSAGLTPAEVAFVRQLHRLFEHVELDETYDGSGIAYLCVPLDLVAELFPEPPDEAA